MQVSHYQCLSQQKHVHLQKHLPTYNIFTIFANEIKINTAFMQLVRHLTYLLLGLLFVSCGYTARYQEAKHVIAVADSLDQNEHVLYDDTAALPLPPT